MFIEAQFPARISYGASGGPVYETSIKQSDAKTENRQNTGFSFCEFQVSTASIKKTDMDALMAFFRVVQGKTNGFRFKDWSDYKVVGGVIGVGNGVKTVFQAIKVYSFGGSSVYRTLEKLVTGTVKVYVDGAEVTSSVNYNTGVITITAPATGAVVTMDCEFDVPCRLDSDYNPIQVNAYNSSKSQNLKIVEITP